MKKNLKSILLLVHYWFPIALGWSIALVVQRATALPILTSGISLYLLCIWAAYSFDRLWDQKDSSNPFWLTLALYVAVLLSAIVGLILVLRLSLQTISALLVFLLMTLLYAKIKKIPFIKFLLVAIVWTWAGVVLPFANQHWFGWQFWTTQTSLPLVMLIACGCILCDFKDISSDKANHVHSLPVMFGLRKTMLVISILLAITALVSFFDHRIGLVVSSGVLIVLTQFPDILSLDAIGPLIVDAALTIPGVLIAFHVV